MAPLVMPRTERSLGGGSVAGLGMLDCAVTALMSSTRARIKQRNHMAESQRLGDMDVLGRATGQRTRERWCCVRNG